MPILSVVIPAYKDTFLGDTLRSLCAQDCTDFEVVVADDASPSDLKAIVDVNRGRFQTRYVRFDKNLGGSSLTAHWQRAIELATGSWILLLGDDDTLDPGLVSAFHAELETTRGGYDLYRFNTRQIDAEGRLICNNPTHPQQEGVADFIRSRFAGQRASFTCEYVFSREALNRAGGFVSFPLAWCSDDATWVALGARTGIRSIDGPKASWRLSGQNISSLSPDRAVTKLCASAQFLAWLGEFLTDPVRNSAQGVRAVREVTLEGMDWFDRQLWWSKCGIPYRDVYRIAGQLASFSGRSRPEFLMKLVRRNLRLGWTAFRNGQATKSNS